MVFAAPGVGATGLVMILYDGRTEYSADASFVYKIPEILGAKWTVANH